MTNRSFINALHNFTDRKAIRQKDEFFKINIDERANETVSGTIKYNYSDILKSINIEDSNDVSFIMEAIVRNDTTRFPLSKTKEQCAFKITNCSEQQKIDFRLKIVSNNSSQNGILIAATRKLISFSGNKDDKKNGMQRKPLLNLKKKDLQGRFWSVEWTNPAEPEIWVNKFFHQQYQDRPDYIEAFIFPEIVREIATGIIFRISDYDTLDTPSTINYWIQFFDEKLGIDLKEYIGIQDYTPEDCLTLIDDLTRAFSEKKWLGDQTLFDKALGLK